jgi:hypothetical protein
MQSLHRSRKAPRAPGGWGGKVVIPTHRPTLPPSGLFCFVSVGVPRQATDALQPTGLLYRPLWTFQLWPPDAPAPTDVFRTLAAEVGTYGLEDKDREFCLMPTSTVHYGSFTCHKSLLKEDVLRIFPPVKIRRLRPRLNPRTWVPEASTLTPRPPKPFPRGYSWHSFLLAAELTQGHSAAGRIKSTKNTNGTIGNRTRDLTACSAVPQPTAPRVTLRISFLSNRKHISYPLQRQIS